MLAHIHQRNAFAGLESEFHWTYAQWRKQWIREIKVFKKCPKVNPYCNAIFDPILFKPFLDGAKWPKFCAKYFSLLKKSNIGCIFFIFLWTIMKGWSDNYEIHTMYASCHVQKKTKKHENYPGSPSLWKWVQSLNIEIFKYFLQFLLKEFKQNSMN